jgi:5-(carboxyamino)imidazole ribonucleotide synthase
VSGTSNRPVQPPSTLGILGGGQLGRYFVMAANTMGYRVIVLEPDPAAPAGSCADVHLIAAYDDVDALARLADQCAVVTTEFENAPATALQRLAEQTAVWPPPAAVAVAQDRRLEKEFIRNLGLPTAPFAVIETDDDIAAAADLGWPAILKTARLGYDGKGQHDVRSTSDLAAAWDATLRVPCVLERRVPLDREVSVMVARTASGEVATYPVTANTHRNGILDVSVAPFDAPDATDLAVAIAEGLNYVGVLGVEMFVSGGALLVNELAPRPHNSYHWTLDAARTSQFEQQVRAVCGLPLGDTSMTAPATAMVNLLGDVWSGGEPDWVGGLTDPAAKLHLYGKHEPRPGRKMGHITVTAESATDAEAAVRHACSAVLRTTS